MTPVGDRRERSSSSLPNIISRYDSEPRPQVSPYAFSSRAEFSLVISTSDSPISTVNEKSAPVMNGGSIYTRSTLPANLSRSEDMTRRLSPQINLLRHPSS